jgi:hypothetical protein
MIPILIGQNLLPYVSGNKHPLIVTILGHPLCTRLLTHLCEANAQKIDVNGMVDRLCHMGVTSQEMRIHTWQAIVLEAYTSQNVNHSNN